MSTILLALPLFLLVQSSLCMVTSTASLGVGAGPTQSVGSWHHPLTPALPWALNTTTASGPTSVKHASAQPTATVIVGSAGELRFMPASLNASVGSIVAFDFLGLNHTLTQSTLRDPCYKNGTIDTGFNQFNPANSSGRFLVEIEVTSRDPQWFFCAQLSNISHCHAGMLFSLNPNGKFQEFVSNAKNAAPNSTTTAHACQVTSLSSAARSSQSARPSPSSTSRDLISTKTSYPSSTLRSQPTGNGSLAISSAISSQSTHSIAISLSIQVLAVIFFFS